MNKYIFSCFMVSLSYCFIVLLCLHQGSLRLSLTYLLEVQQMAVRDCSARYVQTYLIKLPFHYRCKLRV